MNKVANTSMEANQKSSDLQYKCWNRWLRWQRCWLASFKLLSISTIVVIGLGGLFGFKIELIFLMFTWLMVQIVSMLFTCDVFNEISRICTLNERCFVGLMVDTFTLRGIVILENRVALIKVLQDLDSEDGHLLTQSQRNKLDKELLITDTEMIRAILAAWDKIGNSHAIPYLEKLSLKGDNLDNDLIAEAEECLVLIKLRADQENNSLTLLRQSMPSISPDGLLRPVTETSNEVVTDETEELLRPALEQDHVEENCGNLLTSGNP